MSANLPIDTPQSLPTPKQSPAKASNQNCMLSSILPSEFSTSFIASHKINPKPSPIDYSNLRQSPQTRENFVDHMANLIKPGENNGFYKALGRVASESTTPQKSQINSIQNIPFNLTLPVASYSPLLQATALQTNYHNVLHEEYQQRLIQHETEDIVEIKQRPPNLTVGDDEAASGILQLL